jgi:LysR family nitrogen assimilation transcriptional regulator
LDLRQLAYFLEICEGASISQASHRANVSQPALSRQLKLLEQELGVELFIRTARGSALTDAGTILRERADRLLKDVGTLRHDVVSSALEPRGELTVGTLTSLLAYLAAPALSSFRTKYPNVSFRIKEGTSRAMRDAVASGRVDVAFVSMIEDIAGFKVCPLVTEKLFLVGHHDLGLDATQPAPIGLLSEGPLILTARPNSLRVVVDRALGRIGREPKVAFEVETLTLAMQLVKLRQGLSVFPYSAIDEYVAREEVSASPLRDIRMSWALVYSNDRAPSAATRLFVETVKRHASDKILAGNWPTAKLKP